MKSAEVKIKGLESVKRTLKGLDDAVFEDVTLKLRGVAFRMYAEILTRSPVDTGRYRANWTPPDVSENGGVFRAVISNNRFKAAMHNNRCNRRHLHSGPVRIAVV